MIEFIGYLVVYIIITLSIVIATTYFFTKVGILPNIKLPFLIQDSDYRSFLETKRIASAPHINEVQHKDLEDFFGENLVRIYNFNYKRSINKSKYYGGEDTSNMEMPYRKLITELPVRYRQTHVVRHEVNPRTHNTHSTGMRLSHRGKSPAKKIKQGLKRSGLSLKYASSKIIPWDCSDSIH